MAGEKSSAILNVVTLLLSLQNWIAGEELPFSLSCPTYSQVLLGQVNLPTTGCNFSRIDSGSEHILEAVNTTGDYFYTCNNSSGNLSIVLSQYHVALCQGCENHIHTVYVGTAVIWTPATKPCGNVVIAEGGRYIANVPDAYYNFNKNGDYQLYCTSAPATRAAIRVIGSQPASRQYMALLYAHAAAMILAFGVLLPVGAFMAHGQRPFVHKLTQPTGIAVGLAGLAMIVAYVQVTSRAHFRLTVHAVVGVVILALSLATPLLLVRIQWRRWHRGCGHVITCLGLANILLGLAIWPAAKEAAVTVGVVYGIWLLTIMAVYVLKVVGNGTTLVMPKPRCPDSEAPPTTTTATHKSNSVLKPLSKGVISEAKMVQLRKKSIDYHDAIKQREALNKELGLTSTPAHANEADANQSTRTAETDLSVGAEPNCAKENLCRSPTPQHTLPSPPHHVQQQPYLSPEPQTPPPTQEDNQTTMNVTLGTSDDEDDDVLSEKEGVASLDPNRFNHCSPSPIKKAHSFSVPPRHLNLHLDKASHGDSLRVTRHSVKSPPKPRKDELTVENTAGGPGTLNARRRRPALVPPIITTTPAEEELGCILTKQVSVDSMGGRDLSPCPSTLSLQGESKPRKKKVSVAALEAVPIPPTPVGLQPPPLSRSASFSQTNVFSDNALRSVMQMSHDAIVCANANGDIVFWSAGAVKMFGYTPGEAIGSSLEMVIPSQYKERHRGGISKRTDETMKYIRKHSYTPEEQKHARLYEVHGLSKNGHEFPVEVNVTSFVIDGELFYTGVISELVPKNAQGRSRGTSVSTMGSENHECTMKQKAMAVGAQMKIAHKLKSAEHITQKELENILASSLAASKIEIQKYQLEEMISGIMKAGDPANTGVVTFMNLLPLLYQHRLYISESGLIVRYGKTKSNQGGTTCYKRTVSGIKNFFHGNSSFFLWLGVYLVANITLLIAGMLSNQRAGWGRWAYGTGPVLSMSCVAVLLPMMSSLNQAMCNVPWMAKLFPLHCPLRSHLVVAGGVAFWSAVHVGLHLCSFVLDGRNVTAGEEGGVPTSSDRFVSSLMVHLCPAVTGLLLLMLLGIMCVSAVPFFRKQMRFIAFHLIHWMTTIIVYVLILVHGDQYWNPSFWKWLLPLLFVMAFEIIHRHWFTTKHTVAVKIAGPYDDISRVTLIETEKPKHFDFIPGQFVMLNFQKIDYFGWHRCYISSGPKDPKLTIYIPKEGNVWFTEMFLTLKAHPYNQASCQDTNKSENDNTSPSTDSIPKQLALQLTGPYGAGSNAVFDYKISILVCGGNGPYMSKSLLSKLLQYRKHNSCLCGCHPILTKLYFVWVIPSGNDFEWFTDYLSDLCLDEHLQRYLDIRVFLTNIDSPPDELASALLQLGLKTAGESCIGRRPSQPQLNNLYSMTSYGIPDFDGLLEYIYTQHSNIWNEGGHTEIGVFTVGNVHKTMLDDLNKACRTATRPSQVLFKQSIVVS